MRVNMPVTQKEVKLAPGQTIVWFTTTTIAVFRRHLNKCHPNITIGSLCVCLSISPLGNR